MKRVFTRVAAVLLVCVMVCAFTACATTLKGTYVSTDGLVQQTLTFKEDNIVEVSAFGIETEGEYVIEDGYITITYSLLGLSYDWEARLEKEGSDTLYIDGVQFVKEK